MTPPHPLPLFIKEGVKFSKFSKKKGGLNFSHKNEEVGKIGGAN